MQVASKGWTVQEEETIAHIMGNEKVGRIEAIQAMQRRKKTSKSLSHRLKFKDPFESSAHCQNHHCIDCALTFGETDLEMTAFLDLMLNGKQRSGDYFLVQHDPTAEMFAGSTVFRGLFPVSARMDGDVFVSEAEASTERIDLVPKEPFEPALELTLAGIVESRVYVQRKHTFGEFRKSEETEVLGMAGNKSANVDGLMPVLENLDPDTTLFGNPNKALRGRGRPKVPDSQKRLSGAERQVRFRDKKRHASAPVVA